MGILMDSLPRAVTVLWPIPWIERVLTRSSFVMDVSMQYRKYAGSFGYPAAPLSIITLLNVCWRADMPTVDLRVYVETAGDRLVC